MLSITLVTTDDHPTLEWRYAVSSLMIPGGTLWTGRQSLKCSCPVPDAHILEQVTLEQPVRRPLILVSHPDEGVPFLAKRTFSTLFF